MNIPTEIPGRNDKDDLPKPKGTNIETFKTPIEIKKKPKPPADHAGNIYEKDVITHLQAKFPVTDLDLYTQDEVLYHHQWHNFLNCFDQSNIAYTAQFKVQGIHLSKNFLLPENVTFNHGYIDLLRRFEEDGQLYLQIIDIKNSPVATHFSLLVPTQGALSLSS